MAQGEGERLHARRMRKFWMTLGALALVGAFCGFISGFVNGYADARGEPLQPWMLTAGAAGVVAAGVAAILLSWKFFASVDELEVADNLWGSLVGFYAYGLLLPMWWALDKLGFVRPPDHWLIYGVSMITALAVYGYRKWRYR